MATTATGSVNLSEEFSRISAAKNSFQAVRNANSPTVMTAGFTACTRTLVRAGA